MNGICRHSQQADYCPYCDEENNVEKLEAEIEQLKAQLQMEKALVDVKQGSIDYHIGRYEQLKAERDVWKQEAKNFKRLYKDVSKCRL